MLTNLTDSLLFHLTQKPFNFFVYETSGRTETVSRASIREPFKTLRCRILHSDCRQIRPCLWWQYSPECHRSVQVVGSKLVVIVSLEVSLVVDDCIPRTFKRPPQVKLIWASINTADIRNLIQRQHCSRLELFSEKVHS